jgi:hypothetical protein
LELFFIFLKILFADLEYLDIIYMKGCFGTFIMEWNMGRKKKDPALQALADEERNQIADIDLLTKFKSAGEKRLAQTLLGKYLREFSIENVSDKNTLAQVIYLEVTNLRVQEKLNEIYSKDAKAIPTDLIELMNKNNDSVIKLKNSLGLSKSKDKKDAYSVLEEYKARHKRWQEDNQASRHMKCPWCTQPIWLKIRADIWEAQKHPFFKDTFLYNKVLMDHLGKTVLIDKAFVAAVFGTSAEYIERLLSHVHPKEARNEPVNQEVQPASEMVQDSGI